MDFDAEANADVRMPRNDLVRMVVDIGVDTMRMPSGRGVDKQNLIEKKVK